MRANFEKCLDIVLVHEGGYVNHPADPGGATMKGVTQKVYDRYRATNGRVQQSVRYINQAELREIYKLQYWDLINGDLLPSGVDLAVFDYAVNSGATRATRAVQGIAGVRVDGNLGLNTVAAIKEGPSESFIETLCDERLAFMRRLSTWKTFGKGWSRRVEGIRTTAIAMTQQQFASMDFELLQGGAADDDLSAPADPRQVGFMSTNTGRGVAAQSIGVMGTAVSEASDKIQSVAPFSPVILGVSVLLLLVGLGLTMYGLYKAISEERAA